MAKVIREADAGAAATWFGRPMTDDNRAAAVDHGSSGPAGMPTSGVRPAALAVLRYGAMVFGAAVIVQFYLAGSGIFAATGPVKDASSLDPHRTLGNILAGVALLLVIAMIVARPARRVVLTTVVLFVLTGVEGVLATAGSGSPYVGALHPVVAAVILGAAVGIVFQTRPTGSTGATAR
jgi:hypothetical protein